MEPRSIERGETYLRLERSWSALRLQWSHVQSNVERSPGRAARSGRYRPASMEPRSIERGEARSVPLDPFHPPLQWSHVQSNVESSGEANYCWVNRYKLQWSHVQSNVESLHLVDPVDLLLVRASMEPRSIERGEFSSAAKAISSRSSFNGATFNRTWREAKKRQGARTDLLQWSHVQSNVESTGNIETIPVAHIKLQWSHVQSNVER